jgi:hypothetical protein
LLIHKQFEQSHKQREQDFSRTRKLSFTTVVMGLINLFNRSLAVELNKLLGYLQDKIDAACSKQAFSKQRMKLKAEAFITLNNELIAHFYSDSNFERFHGMRLLACDGSTLALPESTSVIDHFGQATNPVASVAMGRYSLLYDVLNHLTLSAVLMPYKADERMTLIEQLETLADTTQKHENLLLLDRGYPSLLLLAMLKSKGIHFIMRLASSNTFSQLTCFAASGKQDAVVDFDLCMATSKKPAQLRMLIEQLNCSRFPLRMLQFSLPSGETEYLLTDLIDNKQYSSDFFYQAYGLRWAVETEFRQEKSFLEIENFSGKRAETVLQDFHASILCGNLQSLLSLDAAVRREESLKTVAAKPLKHHYKINRSVSIGLLKDELLNLLNSNKPLEETYEKLVCQMQRFVVSSPANRQFSRKRKVKYKSTINRRRPT